MFGVGDACDGRKEGSDGVEGVSNRVVDWGFREPAREEVVSV